MAFKVRDLMINVIGDGGHALRPAEPCGGVSVPTPLTPHTPVLQGVALTPLYERVDVVIKERLQWSRDSGDLEDAHGVVDLIHEVGRELGTEIVAGGVAGGAAMPDPNCAGTSWETIPTPITPVVHKLKNVLTVEHLPQLRQQLRTVLKAVEEAEAALVPNTATEAEFVTEKLQGALGDLKKVARTAQ